MRSTSGSLYTSVLKPVRSPLSFVPKPWQHVCVCARVRVCVCVCMVGSARGAAQ
jgi:hypothetical protein